jgi:hypothetical protein
VYAGPRGSLTETQPGVLTPKKKGYVFLSYTMRLLATLSTLSSGKMLLLIN